MPLCAAALRTVTTNNIVILSEASRTRESDNYKPRIARGGIRKSCGGRQNRIAAGSGRSHAKTRTSSVEAHRGEIEGAGAADHDSIGVYLVHAFEGAYGQREARIPGEVRQSYAPEPANRPQAAGPGVKSMGSV